MHIIVSRPKPGAPADPALPDVLYYAGQEFSTPPDLAAASWAAEARSAWSAEREKATLLSHEAAERLRSIDLRTTDRDLTIEPA